MFANFFQQMKGEKKCSLHYIRAESKIFKFFLLSSQQSETQRLFKDYDTHKSSKSLQPGAETNVGCF